MSKKLMEQVTAALKKAKVELNDEAKDALSEALGSDSLTAAGLVELGSGKKLVEESEYNDLHADLRKTRKRAQDAEGDRDRLKSALDTGDSENKKLAVRYKADLDTIQPRAEKLLKRAREDWTSRAKNLPEAKADAKDDEKARVEKIRSRFVFAEKDKELADDQVLDNLTKYDELSELGVFQVTKPGGNGGGHQDPPPAPRGGGGNQNEQPVDNDKAAVDWYNRTDPKQPQGNAR
jgi:hypothetical protein